MAKKQESVFFYLVQSKYFKSKMPVKVAEKEAMMKVRYFHI